MHWRLQAQITLTVGHALPLIFLALGSIASGMATPLAALAGVTATLSGWLLKIKLWISAACTPKFVIPRASVRGQTG